MRLKLNQAKSYASAMSSEDLFYYARDHDKRDLVRCANNFLVNLNAYEREVPERIRKTLHNFASGKDLAGEVMRVYNLKAS